MAETISIWTLLRTVARFWWLILLSAVAGLVVALMLLSRTPPTYKARMILAPQQNFVSGSRSPSSGGLSSLLSGLSSGSGSDLVKLEILLKSDRLAHIIWSDKPTLQRLFTGNWDPVARQWRPRTGRGVWLLGLLHVQLPAEPTPDEVQAKIESDFVVKAEQQVYRSISFFDRDPENAQRLLHDIVALADRTLREDDRGRINRMIDYTSSRLEGMTVTRQAEALSGLLMTLEQQRMLARASTYYSFDLIQDSEVDAYPSAPRPLIYLATGLIAPPALVIVILLVLGPRRPARQRAESDDQ